MREKNRVGKSHDTVPLRIMLQIIHQYLHSATKIRAFDSLFNFYGLFYVVWHSTKLRLHVVKNEKPAGFWTPPPLLTPPATLNQITGGGGGEIVS